MVGGRVHWPGSRRLVSIRGAQEQKREAEKWWRTSALKAAGSWLCILAQVAMDMTSLSLALLFSSVNGDDNSTCFTVPPVLPKAGT